MRTIVVLAALGVALACTNVGCNRSSSSSGAGAGGTQREILPAEVRTVEQQPGVERTIAEPDIYKLDGTTLYVQNALRGLSVIDVTSASAPRVVTQLPTLLGRSGELFASSGQLFVVFEESNALPGRAEVVSVNQASTTPTVVGRLDVPGFLVVARQLGSTIFLVSTNNTDRTWVSSISVVDPLQIAVASQLQLTGAATEAQVTSSAIFVVQRLTGQAPNETRVRAVDSSNPNALLERGSIDLRGAPQGLFHMDALGTTFRIVTYSGLATGSNVYVIDTTDLTRLTVLGSILGLAPDETLHATRFVGDRAYVVTYERPVVNVTFFVGSFFIGDPVWVISLTDPRNPTVLGELHVPGWSDYVFPRGDRLVAVGRANLGERVAVALYDVHDPTQPTELSRVEFGINGASSEANTDYRGVSIIESGTLGSPPLIAIPYTNNLFATGAGATPGTGTTENFVQLIDLQPNTLMLQGVAPLVGLARRTVPVGGLLYAVTDKTVAAIDVSNRATPVIPASVVVGDLNAVEQPRQVFIDTPIQNVTVVRGCAVGTGPGEAAAFWPLLCVGVLLLGSRCVSLRRPGSACSPLGVRGVAA